MIILVWEGLVETRKSKVGKFNCSACLLHLAAANLQHSWSCVVFMRLAGQAGVTVPAMPGGSWKPRGGIPRRCGSATEIY